MTDFDEPYDADKNDEPRENRGRYTPADGLRVTELKAALAEYGDAYVARGAADARMLRALATGYEIALERARATVAEPGMDLQNEGQIFAWHFRSLLGEFAVGSHDSEQSLRGRAADAHQLVNDFPAWVESIEAGRVDLRHANAMLKFTHLLDQDHLMEYGKLVLEYAETHTPGQTKSYAERLASKIAAEAFEAVHQRARKQRHVTIAHDGVGMAYLTAYIPSEVAQPIGQLLDKQAREIRQAEKVAADEHREAVRVARAAGEEPPAEFVPDGRTIPEIRADIFVDSLLCATPGESRVKAVVSITVPALSLLAGRADGTEPALLDGMLPMSFAEARQLAGEATSFQRVLTDPVTGQVTCVDTYQPDQALRRFIQVRDRVCRFPGCVRPGLVSEVDHTTPYSEGGATSTRNLAVLCKAHHVQKHEKPWSVTNLGGGVLQWRTPLGQIVTTSPEAAGPRFVPTASPQPPTRSDPPPAPSRSDPPQFGVEENSATVPFDEGSAETDRASDADGEAWVAEPDDDPPPF